MELNILAKKANQLSIDAKNLTTKIYEILSNQTQTVSSQDEFLPLVTIFILSCIIGYYVIWKVTPALHTPLMSVTNAVSGIIIIGAITVSGFEEMNAGSVFGIMAIFLASINIFAGFAVTFRMLKMFNKKL